MKITPTLIVIVLLGLVVEAVCIRMWGASHVAVWAVVGAISGGVGVTLMARRRKPNA